MGLLERLISFFEDLRFNVEYIIARRRNARWNRDRQLRRKYIRTEASNAKKLMTCSGVTVLLLLLLLIGMIFPGTAEAAAALLKESWLLRSVLSIAVGAVLLAWVGLFIELILIVRNAHLAKEEFNMLELVSRYGNSSFDAHDEFDEDDDGDVYGYGDFDDDAWTDDWDDEDDDEDEDDEDGLMFGAEGGRRCRRSEAQDAADESASDEKAPEKAPEEAAEDEPEEASEKASEKASEDESEKASEDESEEAAEDESEDESEDEPPVFAEHLRKHREQLERDRAILEAGKGERPWARRRGEVPPVRRSAFVGEEPVRRGEVPPVRRSAFVGEEPMRRGAERFERRRAEEEEPTAVCGREIEGQGRVTVKYTESYIKLLIFEAVKNCDERLYLQALEVKLPDGAIEVEVSAIVGGTSHRELTDKMYAVIRERLGELTDSFRINLSLTMAGVLASE